MKVESSWSMNLSPKERIRIKFFWMGEDREPSDPDEELCLYCVTDKQLGAYKRIYFMLRGEQVLISRSEGREEGTMEYFDGRLAYKPEEYM